MHYFILFIYFNQLIQEFAKVKKVKSLSITVVYVIVFLANVFRSEKTRFDCKYVELSYKQIQFKINKNIVVSIKF